MRVEKRRFQNIPLREAFLRCSVVGDRIDRLRVDGKVIRKEKLCILKQKRVRVNGAFVTRVLWT